MPPRVLNNGNWSVLLLALNTLFRNHRTSSGTGEGCQESEAELESLSLEQLNILTLTLHCAATRLMS